MGPTVHDVQQVVLVPVVVGQFEAASPECLPASLVEPPVLAVPNDDDEFFSVGGIPAEDSPA
eukprot:NODE_5665_length_279_cov_38.256522_g5582_i0.p2 GENE.NODE_5665_length_279_cov_38.256522_g5582_i0~~NODE_5665_length_279_cov_38.256522_g5582_i0.p2  ORF type:complete len:70 (-),score=20.95 NODE_5665_length_279_cov_38.256522_g5582_i0:70-255(-)